MAQKDGKLEALVAPSMLSSDFAKLGEESKRMINDGADWLHMDVMDGHFVPNLTIGAPVIKWVRKECPNAFLDCHLMVSNPKQWIKDFGDAGASQYTFHYEATNEHDAIIDEIIKNQMKVGIAIKPKTPVSDKKDEKKDNNDNNNNNNGPTAFEVISKNINKINQVLIMTVEPGFGGQEFMGDMMPKVEFLRKKFPNLNIQVDGGLNAQTIDTATKAGANVIVSGSGVFKHKDKNGNVNSKEAISILRKSIQANIQ